MIFALICKDKPGGLEVRLANRPAHLDYLTALNAAGKLKFAGPLLDDEGKPVGSLVAVEAGDRAGAEAIAAGDPYARAGLFESVEIHPWNWVFNAPEAG
ncbi:MAG: hypothetical protein DCC69_06830 [Hyphomicrobiales bacterium]|nr:MAG: hypothetical protein DCC69_06830 [Hyphomicrobiales bacterium]